jgi:integrase
MALEIQRGRSKWWYGRIEVNGRKIGKNLGVEVKGTVPPSLAQQGDLAFERSRAKAQAALETFQLDLKKRSTAEELVQTIHEIRTGSRVTEIPLDEIGARWKALPRRRPLSERYQAQAESWIKRFIGFVKLANPAVREMAQVQSTLACRYLNAEEERRVTAKTYNNTLIFLRAVFHALRKEAGLAENPFDGIPTRDGETIFRKPFTAEELAIIVEKAKGDPFIYPLIVTGMCTAMRRGDCCTLLRKSVDLKSGFATVKTSKTGEYVQIPIFPLLREVLEKALAERSPRPPHYVFPSLEAHYRVNPDHLTDRVRRVMRAAGFFDPADARTDEGKNASRGAIHQTRETGLRRASIRDFHSFRVTWVTLALTAGVPLEIVKKVTGHRTAEIVMKHYFQPGREDFRRTLAQKLPALLSGVTPPKSIEDDELTARLRAMNPGNWAALRDELLARLDPDKPIELAAVA